MVGLSSAAVLTTARLFTSSEAGDERRMMGEQLGRTRLLLLPASGSDALLRLSALKSLIRQPAFDILLSPLYFM